jgi:hypothetical protein
VVQCIGRLHALTRFRVTGSSTCLGATAVEGQIVDSKGLATVGHANAIGFRVMFPVFAAGPSGDRYKQATFPAPQNDLLPGLRNERLRVWVQSNHCFARLLGCQGLEGNTTATIGGE